MSVAEAILPACPADESFARLIDGTLAPDRVRELEAHCDACPRCRAALAELARAVSPADDAWLGGRYQLLEPLGAGGMGRGVRGVRHQAAAQGGRQALRDNDSGQLRRGPARAAFLREAQLAGLAVAPNVLTVHDVRRIRPRDYVVTELVDGWPMSGGSRRAPRPGRRDRRPLLQAGVALGGAHTSSTATSRPENILVARNGRS